MDLNVKPPFMCHSDRVKCVDIHSEKPFLLVALHSGGIQTWNYETDCLIRLSKIANAPIRTAKFVVRENWIVAGCDDGHIRVLDADTFVLLHQFCAHPDYIRSLVVHPVHPCVISTSDDMTVRVWNWANGWSLEQTVEEHHHYVMQVAINPRDTDIIATASLDKQIKLWRLGEAESLMTLKGHLHGVNCVDFHGDTQLISGSDDKTVKIWDLQTGTCLATLEGHTNNVTSVRSLNSRICSGAEDSSLKIWNTESLSLERTDQFGMGRAWCIDARNDVLASGWDSGAVVVKLC